MGTLDTILFFGNPILKYYLPDLTTDGNNYILQGVGGSNGLTILRPVSVVVSGGFYSTTLVCFQSGDSLYHPNSFIHPTVDCLEFIPIGISELNDKEDRISIWPNPITSQLNIEFEKEQKNIIIKITDPIGKNFKQINFSGKYLKVEKGNLSAGIYFVQIFDEHKIISNKEIIIE